MANPKDKPLKERLKKFISQYTDSKANAVNLFMYGIIGLFLCLLVIVLIFTFQLKDGLEGIQFADPAAELEQIHQQEEAANADTKK